MTARDRLVVVVLACAALIAAAWFVLLAPKRAERRDLGAELSTLQADLASAQQAVATGRAARASHGADEAALARIGTAVPPDEQFPSLLIQVQAAAERSGIVFRTLALSGQSGAPGPSTAIVSGTTGASGASGAAGPTTDAEPAPDGGATQATATGALPPGVVVDGSGLPTLPFDFTFTGRYFDLEGLLGRLSGLVRTTQDDVDATGRLLDVDAFALTASAKGLPRMDAAVHAKAYLWPTAAPAGPAGPSAPSVTATDAAAAAATAPAPPDAANGPTVIPPASTGARPR